MDDTHQFGTGFAVMGAVHKDYESCVKEFNQVSECRCTIQLDTKPLNTFIINIQIPLNVKKTLRRKNSMKIVHPEIR